VKFKFRPRDVLPRGKAMRTGAEEKRGRDKEESEINRDPSLSLSLSLLPRRGQQQIFLENRRWIGAPRCDVSMGGVNVCVSRK